MGRRGWVARRLLAAAVTLFLTLTLNFVLFRVLPGSAVSDLSRVPRATPALKAALIRHFGLDQPLWHQYLAYLGRLAHGDLGVSFDNQQPVWDNLRTALANTLPLVLVATVVAIALGTLVGVVSAWRRGTVVDHLSTGVAVALFSFPVQWLGLMLVILFAGRLPTGGMTDAFLFHPGLWRHLADVATHMVLPGLTLALGLYGSFTLVVRSSMLETLGEDYLLTARAKGLPAWMVVRRHALRNALLPTTTLVALTLGHLVAGAILVETVFSWPGIGRTVYSALLDRDYPMLQGAFLVLTVSVLAANVTADLLYARLDPRVGT